MSTDEERRQQLTASQERRDILLQQQRSHLVDRAMNRLRQSTALPADTVAAADRVSEQVGMPAAALIESPEDLKAFEDDARKRSALDRSPPLSSWVEEDPANAALSQDDLDTMAAYDELMTRVNPKGTGVGRAAKRGVLTVQSAPQIYTASAAATALSDSALEEGELAARVFEQVTGMDTPPGGGDIDSYQTAVEAISELGLPATYSNNFVEVYSLRKRNADAVRENPEGAIEAGVRSVNELRRLQEEAAALPMSPAASRMRERLAEDQTLLGTAAALSRNPVEAAAFLGEVAAESAVVIVPALTVSVVSRSPSIGTALLAGGAMSQEIGAEGRNFVAEYGAPLKTTEDAIALLNNEQLLQEALSRGVVRGVVIAAFEVMGQGVAARAMFKSAAKTVAAQSGTQMATGSFAEASAQAAVGDDLNMQEILIEGLAEVVTAPLEVATAIDTANRRREDEASEAAQQAETVEELNETVANTKLRDRSPKRYKNFLQKHGIDQRSIYVQADALSEAVADNDTVLELLDISRAQLENAVEAGTLVPVNMATYLQNVPGRNTSLERVFVESGTLNADTMTRSDAEAYTTTEATERAEEAQASSAAEQNIQSMRQEVVTRITDQLVNAGQTRTAARAGAELQGAFFETIARRYGSTEAMRQLQERLDVRGPGTEPAERTGRVLSQPVTPPPDASDDVRRLAEAVNAGTPPEQLLSDPAMQATLDEMGAIPPTDGVENFGTSDFFDARTYNTLAGQEIRGVEAVLTEAEAISAEYAGPGGVRQERKISILLGAPAAGKSTIAEDMAPEMGARIVDSDDIKKLIPEFNGGIGAAAVHEESSLLGKALLDRALLRGDNIVLPKVGDNADKIRQLVEKLQTEGGYTVDVVNMEVDPQEAFSRMVKRFVATGRLIPPDYALQAATKPRETYAQLKEEGIADGYANFDNNVPFGQPVRVIEDERATVDERREPDDGREDGGPVPSGQQASGRAGQEPVPEQGRVLNQSSVPLFDKPLEIDGRVTVRKIGEAMTDWHMEEYGRKLFPEDSEADYDIVLQAASDELEAQLRRPNSGAGWYSKDVELAINETAKLYPEIKTPEGRAVWLTFAGIFSNGLDPSQAWEISAEAFEYWVATGEIPIKRADAARALDREPIMTTFKDRKTKESVTREAGWGIRNPSNEQQLQMFANLIEQEGGPVEAVQWMTSPQSREDINAIVQTVQKAARFKTKKEREGPDTWGALMLSDKLGRYTMGLHGVEVTEDDTTVDLWYTRTYRRLTGRLLDKPVGKEGVAATPSPNRDGIERKTIFRLTGDLSRRFGDLPAGDVQAMLWFFEKRLWGAQGLRTDEGTNSAGARRLLEKNDIEFDDGERSSTEGDEAGQEPAGGDAEGVRRLLQSASSEGRGREGGEQEGRGSDAEYVTADDLERIDDEEFFQEFLTRPGWAVVTATNENLPEVIRESRNAESNAYMQELLRERGIPHAVLTGTYKGEPQGESFLIIADEATAVKLGRTFNQESILTNEGLVYSSKPLPPTPTTGEVVIGEEARGGEFFSETEGGTAFALGLDFSQGPGAPVIPDGYTVRPDRPQLPVRPDGMVELHHWSDQQLETVDPSFAGTGPMQGAERRRGAKLGFFGINPRETLRQAGTGYVKEAQLGEVEHVALVRPDDLYPLFEDPDGIAAGKNIDDAEASIREAGYKGYYTTDDGGGSAPLGNVAALFDATPVVPVEELRAYDEQQEIGRAVARDSLRQSDRGQILLPVDGVLSGDTVIELFKDADLSTFLHESGHYFLEAFQAFASRDDAPQQMKDDLAAINDFLGRDEGDTSTFTTEQQEQWAESFEAYLMEGKAPSLTLKSAFSKFASWLVEIYKRAANIGAQPTPEIREVMDRMLATDEELAVARAATDSQALFAEIPPGMSQQEWEPYARLVQREEGETRGRLLNKAMAKIRRRREAEYEKRRAEIASEVEEELKQERVYRVLEGLGNGGFGKSGRLDKKQLVSIFGEQVLQDLKRERFNTKTNLYIEQGTDVEIVADTLGYDSIGQMITELRSTEPLTKAVETETARRLENEVGDPLDETSIKEEAEAALKTPTAAERVAREASTLSRQAGVPRGRSRWQDQNAAAKLEAEKRVNRMSVRDVMGYRQFLRASQTKAREAQRQLASVVRKADGTPQPGSRAALQAAAEAKRAQLLNDHMYRIAREKSRRFEAARKRFARFSKKSIKQNIGADFMDGIDTLLDQYSFRQLTVKEVKRRADIRELYQNVINENRGAELAIPADVLARVENVHYTELTAQQLEGVIDAIDNLAHMGRATTKQIAADQQFDFATAMDAIEARADDNLTSRPLERERGERRTGADFYRQFQLHVLNADSILRDIDGDETALGPAYNSIKREIDAGVANADARRQEAAKDIVDIYRRNLGSNKEISALRNNKKVYPELNGEAITKLGLISLALNSGNATNWERITNSEGKGTYNADALRQVLLRELSENEWRFVQDMWDYLDSYWPEIRDQERKYTGVTPKKVTTELMIEGAPDFVKGGYYPIRYDYGYSTNVDDMERAKLATEGTVGVFGKAQTSNGHAQERMASTGRPIDLSLDIIDNHVYNVIHDLELRGPIRDAARIVYSERFGDMMTDKGRAEDTRALKAWLEDVAVGDKVGAYGASRWFRWMRGGFTLSAIGFKISTIMIQPLGLTQSMVQVGYKNMVRGYSQVLKQGHRRSHEFAVSKSNIMAERIRTFDRDISQITENIASGTALKKGYARVLDFYLPWAYVGMQHMQYWVVDLPTWMASYEGALRDGQSDTDAVVIADRDVRIAQGSGLLSDRGMMERGRFSPDGKTSELPRLFTVLGSYMFSKFNLAYRRARGTDFKDPFAIAKLSMDFAMLFVVEATLVYLLRNGWPEEEDDEPPMPLIAAREGLYTAMGTMPIVRDVASALQGFGGGNAYSEYTGAAQSLFDGLGDIGSGEVDRRTLEGLLGFGGTAFFLPSGQLNDMLDAIWTKDFEVEDDWIANLLESMTGLPIGGENES